MASSKPSLELLRRLSDEHVLGALIEAPRLTRAQIATRSGLSKPTVGESVRRLVEAGLVHDTGAVTSGRGRAGTLYALADDLGLALVVDIAPGGIHAEALDVYGRVVATSVAEVERPATPDVVARALRSATGAVAAAGRIRLAVVSAADPVDRHTGRLVHLPDTPFLVGELSPAAVLAPVVEGAVTVDNDVNWAARAERSAAEDAPDDFAYLYLGEGLGCALVADGAVLRGASGLAGEVSHVLTTGPSGQALPFTEVFAELGLRQPGSAAVDVHATVAAIEGRPADGGGAATLGHLATAVCGVLSAVVALTDPDVVVVGGPWGSHPTLLEAVEEASAAMPRTVRLRPAASTGHPSLAGARQEAVARLRAWVTSDGPTRPARPLGL